jgi:hypothetical protein
MGDRVSVSFRKGNEESVVLFSHWGGMGFVEDAQNYARLLQIEREGSGMPLDRFEPNTVMVDFIRGVTQGMTRVESDLYLGQDSEDGDNSDNGHHIVDLPPFAR